MSNIKHLHIVAFDVPFPPVYGGAIDLYFQLKTLHQIGIEVTYHCFYYKGNNPPTERLSALSQKVYYYHRQKNPLKLFSKQPFIVATRNHKALLKNLEADSSPILFSGLQSCYFLDHPSLKNRIKLVRTHNIEHHYYRGLAKVESNFLKRHYFLQEAKKLEKFEKKLVHAQGIFSIAKSDLDHFSQYASCFHSPPFFRLNERETGFDKRSEFGLFQGNLNVGENIETVLFIAKHIAPKTDYQIIIAGKNPHQLVRKIVEKTPNLELLANPDQKKMNSLIEEAQVNLLFTKQQTGIKLKLVNALAIGKHVIINSKMDDSGLFQPLCSIEDDVKKIPLLFNEKMTETFTKEMFLSRQEKFLQTFSNVKNAKELMRIINTLMVPNN